jgi:zinc protease
MSEAVVRSRALVFAGLLTLAIATAVGAPCFTWGSGSAALSRDLIPRMNAVAAAPPEIRVADLPNGMRIAAVPFPEPDAIALCTVIRAGARNETGPGETGLAGRLERLVLGIGAPPSPPADEDALFRLGARVSGFSTEDYACRIVLFAGRENLDAVLRAEAARLTETRDFEGKLRALGPALDRQTRAAGDDPVARLMAALRGAAFADHPYGKYPGILGPAPADPAARAEALRTFAARFYAPENTVIFAVGDIVPDRLFESAKKHYGGWARSGYVFEPGGEPPAAEPKRIDVEGVSGAAALLAVAFRGPAFSDSDPAPAALDIIAAAAFSPASPFPRRLVAEERRCRWLTADFHAARDPSILVLSAAVRQPADLPAVETEILAEVERIGSDGLSPRALAEAKARLRSKIERKRATVEGLAGIVASLAGLSGDPTPLDRHLSRYDKILPSDILRAARTYLRVRGSVTATLVGK